MYLTIDNHESVNVQLINVIEASPHDNKQVPLPPSLCQYLATCIEPYQKHPNSTTSVQGSQYAIPWGGLAQSSPLYCYVWSHTATITSLRCAFRWFSRHLTELPKPFVVVGEEEASINETNIVRESLL